MVDSIKVEMQPLNSNGTYDPVIDVTDYVLQNGVGNISQQIDAGDYDIGLYVYSDLNLKLSNYEGKFSSDKYSRSIFHYTRDRACVTVTYTSGTDNIVFMGIINDEASREDLKRGQVSLRVLSLDSILRKTKVAGGLIGSGATVSSAISSILNLPAITGVLGYDAAKINVGIDSIIDDVSVFSDRTTKEVLEELLNASGSIFRVDSSNDMVVAARSVNAVSTLNLYSNDLLGRDNIIDIKEYNSGLHRSFNSVTVNENTSSDENYVDEFGARIKDFTFDFITDDTKSKAIADYLLGQFKVPKQELEVTVTVDTAKDLEILDPVTVDFKKQFIGWEGARAPLYGSAVYGTDKYPYAGGGLRISNGIDWKITGIKHDIKKFQTTLRLREV